MQFKLNHANKYGVVLAPVVAPIAILFLDDGFFAYVFFSLAAYLGMFLVGIPVIEYLHRRNKMVAPWITLCGLASGGLIGGSIYFAIECVLGGGFSRAIEGTFSGLGLLAFVIGASLGVLVAVTYLIISYSMQYAPRKR